MSNVLSPTPGLRQRKKAATWRALHHAARDLAESRRLSEVTVEAIAERADVSARTFFNHFGSKEEAVLGWDPTSIDAVAADVGSALAGGSAPLAALRIALTDLAIAEAFGQETLSRRMALLRREPTLLASSFAHWEQMTSRLVEVVAEALPDADGLYPTVVVQVAVATLRAALAHWSAAPLPDPLHRDLVTHIQRAFQALDGGLAAPEPPR